MGSMPIKIGRPLPFSLFFTLLSRLPPSSHQLVAHPRVLFLDENWPIGKELDVKICAETEMDSNQQKGQEKDGKTVPVGVHLVRPSNERDRDDHAELFSVVRVNESCFTLMLNKPLEADPPLPPSNSDAFPPSVCPPFSLLFERDDTGDHASVQVQLVDVNDNAPRFLGGPFPEELIVPKGSSPGFLLRRLEVVDMDRGIGGICRFSLERTTPKNGAGEGQMFELDTQRCKWPRCSADLRLKRRMAPGEMAKVRVKARDGAGLTRSANEAMVELEVKVGGGRGRGGEGEEGGDGRGRNMEEEMDEDDHWEEKAAGTNGGERKTEKENGREEEWKMKEEREGGRREEERKMKEEREGGRREEERKMKERGGGGGEERKMGSKGETVKEKDLLKENNTSAEHRIVSASSASPSSPAFSPPFHTFLIDHLSEDAPDGFELLRLRLPPGLSPHFVFLNSNGSADGLRIFADGSVRVKGPLDAQKTKEIVAEVRRMGRGGADNAAVAVIRARIWPMMDKFREWVRREIPQDGQIRVEGTGRWVRVLELPEELHKYAQVVAGDGVKMVGRELVVENDGRGEGGKAGKEGKMERRKGKQEGQGRATGGRERGEGGRGEEWEGGEGEQGGREKGGGGREKEEEGGGKEKEEEGEEGHGRKKCFELEMRFRHDRLRRRLCARLPPSPSREWLLRLQWPPSAFRLSFPENLPLPPVLLQPKVRIVFPPFAFPSFSLLDNFTDSAQFHIDPSLGQLSFANPSRMFDFETQKFYSVGVSVCVSAGSRRSGCQQFVLRIDVEDSNDHCPKFEGPHQNQTLHIREDFSPGLALPIAHFPQAIDVDGTDQFRSVCYRLVHSFGQTFAIPNPEKTELFLTKTLDKEAVSSYELQIETDDCPGVFRRCVASSDHSLPSSSPHPSSFRLFISVSDVNDNPPRFIRRHFFAPLIRLAVKPGDALIRLRADDPDQTDQKGRLRFAWAERMAKTEGDPIPIDAIPFHLHCIGGELSLKNAFAHSVVPPFAHSSYTFQVVVRDSDNKHEDFASVTVSVLDPSVHIAQLNFGVDSLLLADQLDLFEQLLSVAIGSEWHVLSQQLSRCGTNCSRMSVYFLAKGTFQPIEAKMVVNRLKAVPKGENGEQKMALYALRERFGLRIDEGKPAHPVPFPSGAGHSLLSASFVLLALFFLLLLFIFAYRRRKGKNIRRRANGMGMGGTKRGKAFGRGPKREAIATEGRTIKINSAAEEAKRSFEKSDHFVPVPQMYGGDAAMNLALSIGTLPLFIPRLRPTNGTTFRTEF